MTVYYATNRMNAVDILTRSIVHPKLEADKHYRDLSDLAPGGFPLLNTGISPALGSWLGKDGESSFPILIELSEIGSEVSFNEDGVAWMRGAVPVTSPVLHFADDDSRTEFTSRTFKNIDLAGVATVVTPELFEGSIDVDVVETAAVASENEEGHDVFGFADRIAGAAVMAFNGASDKASAQSAGVVLDGLPNSTATLLEVIGQLVTVAPDTISGDETALLEWLASALCDDPQSVREGRVAFVDRMQHELGVKDPEFLRNLDRLRSILNGDDVFEGFRGEGGLTAIKALLLFLIRPEPEDVTGWLKEDIGADASTMMLAATMAGVGRGYRGLAADCRGPETMQNYIARSTADMINRTVAEGSNYTGAGSVKASASESQGLVRITLKRGRTVLGERSVMEPGLKGHLLRSDALTGSDHDVALRISRALNWDDAVATVVEAEVYRAEKGSRGVLLRFDGRPVIREEVLVDSFKRRLTKVTNREIEEIARPRVEEGSESQSTPSEGQSALDFHAGP